MLKIGNAEKLKTKKPLHYSRARRRRGKNNAQKITNFLKPYKDMKNNEETQQATFLIRTHKPKSKEKAAFYIQSKGHHAGRPMKEPIVNCFAVDTQDPLLYYIVFSMFITKKFKSIQIGSVIPFIRIKEVKKLINHFTPFADKKDLSKLDAVEGLITVLYEKYTLAVEVRNSYANRAISIKAPQA